MSENVTATTNGGFEAPLPKLTRDQAAVISAYTGFLAGPFSDMHAYVERIMRRPVWTHEMADEGICEQIRQAAKADFLSLAAQEPQA